MQKLMVTSYTLQQGGHGKQRKNKIKGIESTLFRELMGAITYN